MKLKFEIEVEIAPYGTVNNFYEEEVKEVLSSLMERSERYVGEKYQVLGVLGQANVIFTMARNV